MKRFKFLKKYAFLLMVFLAGWVLLCWNSARFGHVDEGYNNFDICVDGRIRAFRDNQVRIMRSMWPDRYVLVRKNTAGYANKMNSVLTGLFVALVTNSALVVEMDHIEKYIEEPFYNTFMTKEPRRSVLRFLHRPGSIFHFPDQTNNSYNTNKSLVHLYRSIPSHTSRYIHKGIGAIFFELACNVSHFQALFDYGLVSVSTLTSAARVLNTKNLRDYKEHADILFRVGFEYAHNALKLFWRPKISLQFIIDQLYDRLFKGHYVIGIQYRKFYLSWPDGVLMAQCAMQIEIEAVKRGHSVRWYVSTDDPAFLLKFKSIYGSNRVIHAQGKISHVAEDPRGFQRALIDIELMSKCDELIISGGSTFGFLAAVKMNHYPLFVNGRLNATRCERFSFINSSQTHNNFTIF